MSESAGRVLMIPKGTYSPTTTYDPLDAVKYEQNSYVCKQTSRGNLPTNTTYWQPLTDVTADEIPTEDSTNLVQSGGVYSALKTFTKQITVNGAVNRLPNSFADAVSKGVTLTNNSDGTLNVSGTNDGTGNGYFRNSDFKVPDSGLYKMTGLPETVAGSSIIDLYLFNVTDNQNVSAYATYIQDYIYNLDSSKTYRAVITVYSGRTVPSDTIIKPMLSLASLNLHYGDYVPYAKSNKELTGLLTIKETTVSDNSGAYGIIGGGFTSNIDKKIPLTVHWTSSEKPALTHFAWSTTYNSWYIVCENWDGTRFTNKDLTGTLRYLDLT
jgi:hypothetical protein